MKKLLIYIKNYSFLLGIALFVVILSKTNLKEIFETIKKIEPLYLIFSILLILPMITNKAWCWNYIKRKQNIKYSLKDSLLMYMVGIYVGTLTPGKLGEITKILYLKKDGYSVGESMVGVFLDRISDLVFLIIFAIIGSMFFINLIYGKFILLIMIMGTLFMLFVIALRVGLIKYFTKKLFYKIIPEKYQKSWQIGFQDFLNDIKIYKFKNYLVILGITCLSWLFYYLQIYFLAKGLNINIPFLYLSISATIAGLITLIPVSVSGIGTRDAALLVLFASFSVSAEKVIALSALILLMSLISAMAGLVCWIVRPIKI